MSEVAARRYSVALFEAGREQGKIDTYFEQIKDVAAVLSDHKDLMELLTHPNIEKKDKKRVVGDIFKDKIDEEIIKLISLLIDHERIKEIKLVYEDYKSLVYEFRGIEVAYVTTAVKMLDSEVNAIKEKLSKKYNCTIEVENIIDEKIIGGVYLRIGDEVIDGTVKGTLEKIRKEIMK